MPLIKVDLSLTDAEFGADIICVGLDLWSTCTGGGICRDLFSKKNIIAVSLLFWSLATLGTGLCSTLVQFILLRGVATGGGEAFYAPPANALLSSHHHRTRSLALAIQSNGGLCLGLY